jgi:hypothetical protein
MVEEFYSFCWAEVEAALAQIGVDQQTFYQVAPPPPTVWQITETSDIAAMAFDPAFLREGQPVYPSAATNYVQVWNMSLVGGPDAVPVTCSNYCTLLAALPPSFPRFVTERLSAALGAQVDFTFCPCWNNSCPGTAASTSLTSGQWFTTVTTSAASHIQLSFTLVLAIADLACLVFGLSRVTF